MTTLPAQALTWTLSGTTGTDTFTAGSSFTIDNEAGNPPNVIAPTNLTIGSITFTQAHFDSLLSGLPNNTISISFINGLNNLALQFNSPLTTAGGLITLDTTVSNFNGTNFTSGSASASPSVSSNSVPFEFSTTPGLVALGLIFGGNYAWKKWNNKNDNQKDNDQNIK